MKKTEGKSPEMIPDSLLKQEQPTLSIIYGVRLRKSKRPRIVIELGRDIYHKQLGHLAGEQIKFASKKPRLFFDEEDEVNLLKACQHFEEPKRIGSIELKLFLVRGPIIYVSYSSGELFARWTPEGGLRLSPVAHPGLSGDKKYIAKVCSQLPAGSGGIFVGDPVEGSIL